MKKCTCNDIVFHTMNISDLDKILKELKPIRQEKDLPIKERKNKIFTYPDIESYKKGYLHRSGLIAICVDNKKTMVSDDYESFHKNEKEWRRKRITLEEWRRLSEIDKESYYSPEAIIDIKDVCTDNIFGVFLTHGNKIIPISIPELCGSLYKK